MERLRDHRHAEAISAARLLIPPAINQLLRPHFLTGVDPVYAGLHDYDECSFGRSYRNTAHVAEPVHQWGLPLDQRRVTVVLPEVEAVKDIVHELGHVLDYELGHRHTAAPVSWYAEVDRGEAFAEAFAAWLIPGYVSQRVDPATMALFNQLAEA